MVWFGGGEGGGSLMLNVRRQFAIKYQKARSCFIARVQFYSFAGIVDSLQNKFNYYVDL